MSKATDRAIERVEEFIGNEVVGSRVPPRDLRKQLRSLVMAGWRERKNEPPYAD